GVNVAQQAGRKVARLQEFQCGARRTPSGCVWRAARSLGAACARRFDTAGCREVAHVSDSFGRRGCLPRPILLPARATLPLTGKTNCASSSRWNFHTVRGGAGVWERGGEWEGGGYGVRSTQPRLALAGQPAEASEVFGDFGSLGCQPLLRVPFSVLRTLCPLRRLRPPPAMAGAGRSRYNQRRVRTPESRFGGGRTCASRRCRGPATTTSTSTVSASRCRATRPR